MYVIYVPFILQAVAMFFDEFYFHRKRGLPTWEKIGHPLDSLTVFACYLFIASLPATTTNVWIYVGLSFFSCIFVTKDEFVHTKYCEARENWLHAVLFILHPITFLSAGMIWKLELNSRFLDLQPVVILIFILYQIIYWSFYDRRKPIPIKK